MQIHITSSEEQHAYLSSLDNLDEIKAILPLGSGGVFTEEEKKLYNIISDSQKGSRLDDLDGGIRIPQDMTPRTRDALELPAESDENVEVNEKDVSSTSSHIKHVLSSPPLLVLAVSCIAALLAVLCVGVALYITSYLRPSLLSSELAWNILPQLERQLAPRGSNDGIGGQKEVQYDEKTGALVVRQPGQERARSIGTEEVKTQEETLDLISFDDDELEEKFHDAEDRPLLFSDNHPSTPRVHDELPRVVVDFADPDFLPLPRSDSPFYTPQHTPMHTPPRSPAKPPLQMRAARPGSPVSMPAWSLRAADSPSFAVNSDSGTPLRIPGSLFPDALSATDTPGASRRMPNDPNAHIDIALALQLRPGLGLGADSAWLVRFIMSMFGWMTVLLGRGVSSY